MKRGKDEEKTMGPMFPRLHVNDTEKGGPRAPPRNKMALYEQLSIPSQRFNGGNPVPPSSSSSQGVVSARGSFFPPRQPPSNHLSDLNIQLVQQEQQKKQEEDDFRVPIFVQQSRISPNRSENHQNRDTEDPSPLSSSFSGHLANAQKAIEKENPREFAKFASNRSSRQSTKVPTKEANGSSSFGQKNASNNSISLQNNGVFRDSVVNAQINEEFRAKGYGNSSVATRDIQEQVLRSSNDLNNGDEVSETSMVDSISGVDITPDDVVGIIGQKHFWKARRAIVNQQRVFSIQVFELHRLIKVQRLMAGSPQLLVEDDAYIRKPVKVSPIKRIPRDYLLKTTPNVPKQKVDHEKSNVDLEASGENAVGKASLSSVQNTSYQSFSGFSLPPADPKMGSWGFNQPSNHQWLIPVMSPSEGLVYKPYPGPGFMTPGCGGYGPPGSMPLPMIAPNFGAPPSHHHYQGPTRVHPFVPVASHGYFPPYGMPAMNPNVSALGGEQTNAPLSFERQSSCDVPNLVQGIEVQGSTASSPSERIRGGNVNALPLFPTSPLAERAPQSSGGVEPARVIRVVPHNARSATESVALAERDPQPSGGVEPARVIRVVPRNARSATESVARIFQSIQEERKQ